MRQFYLLVKKIVLIGVSGAVLSQSTIAQADTAQMNIQLAKMVNQLDAMMPLIKAAEQAQDHNTFVQFHFEHWTDVNGVKHNGLHQDVAAIRAALIAQINQPDLTPHEIQPLQHDYIQH